MPEIDCSMMSHPACYDAEPAEDATEPQKPAASDQHETPVFASYDCVDHCVSSLGVTTQAAGAVTGLACLALSPVGCAFVVGASASLFVAACNDACLELESK